MSEQRNIPLVSVVVPTRNSARTLEACLRSVRAQSHARTELILVDNESVDDTRAIADRIADKVLAAGPERSAQRNAGAAAAEGTYLLFVDSDMVLMPDVVERCVAAARGNDAAVIIGEESIGDGFWARCKRLERSCYVDDPEIEAARFFSRATFVAIGGYDEELLGPEDWDLHARAIAAGSAVRRIGLRIVHDEGRLRLRDTMAKKFLYGRTMATYVRRHGAYARRQLRFLRPAFVRHRRVLLAHPRLAAGMFFMKACEFAAGCAGLAVGVLVRGGRPT